MERAHIFLGLSLLSFASMLFSPSNTWIWAGLLALGIVFGLLWLKFK